MGSFIVPVRPDLLIRVSGSLPRFALFIQATLVFIVAFLFRAGGTGVLLTVHQRFVPHRSVGGPLYHFTAAAGYEKEDRETRSRNDTLHGSPSS